MTTGYCHVDFGEDNETHTTITFSSTCDNYQGNTGLVFNNNKFEVYDPYKEKLNRFWNKYCNG